MELLEEGMDAKEKELKLIEILKTMPKFDLIQKRWAVASRMRTFYQELKKSISEAIEKKRQRQKLGLNTEEEGLS